MNNLDYKKQGINKHISHQSIKRKADVNGHTLKKLWKGSMCDPNNTNFTSKHWCVYYGYRSYRHYSAYSSIIGFPNLKKDLRTYRRSNNMKIKYHLSKYKNINDLNEFDCFEKYKIKHFLK